MIAVNFARVEFFDRYRRFWADGPWTGAYTTSDPCVGIPGPNPQCRADGGLVIPERRANR